MKVGCQQCGAAYSVADEKVAGRSLRLRCKKCGESIQVDGKSLAPPSEPSRAASRPPMTRAPVAQESGADWHVAVGETTQGPYTLDEIAEYYADGSIVLDTLLYREGWPDWVPAGEVEALQEAAGALLARPTPPALPSPPVQARRGTMGSDPFAEPAAPVASPRVSAAEMFSGPQHEGTVQFSFDQIRALSAVSAPSSLPATPARPGYASGSGSGLIDMASLVQEEAEQEQEFEPISFGQGSPLDTIAPMSLPIMPQSAGLDFRTKALAGVAALGFALAGGIGVLAVTRRPAPVAPVAVSAIVAPLPAAPQAILAPPAQAALAAIVTAPVQPTDEVAAEAPEPSAEPAASRPSARHKSAAKASGDEAPQVASKSQKHGGKHAGDKHEDLELIAKASSEKSSSAKTSGEKSSSAKSSSVDIDDLMVKNPPKTGGPKKGGSASIDELLDDAVSAKKQPPKSEAAPEPKSDLPKTPSRDEMLASLAKAGAKAKACKGQGVALAVITITGKSGRATGVSVSGVEGPGKSCVENAVRSTPFPKFQKEDFQVKFPFKLGG